MRMEMAFGTTMEFRGGFLGFESECSTVTKFKAEPLIPPNTPNIKDLGNIVKVTHRV